LPQKIEVRRTWSGIGFRLGEYLLVSPTSEIIEILKCPPLTRVPSALSWVKGIANIRGTLLPVIELKGFL
ncbi:MAG: chemotaxis protein CheW, partial [Gammaproteobacteria bacterium]|nr:chemotaxis protein CheW [Gammaproteobacteria bacterium]NIR94082.1 chemotaxis protein CheW [Gammaproteobacteria bacterium]